jgi:outer membrane receptor protein involved in Fe transport
MGKIRSNLPSAAAFAIIAAGFATTPTQAQTATSESTSGARLEEVVVTATKRSQSVQDVPVSITALSARDLDAMGANRFFDYATDIPNLSFGIGASDGNLAGRGIALRGIQGSNTTGFYIDETPVLETLDPHIVDIARIEVLRGPQGTLYGAESMGGTVRIITEQPDVSGRGVTGQVHVGGSWTEHGGFNNLEEGVVNIPLVTDTLAVRMSVFHQFDDGFFNKDIGPYSAPPHVHPHAGGQHAVLRRADRHQIPADGRAIHNTANHVSAHGAGRCPVRVQLRREPHAARGVRPLHGRYGQVVPGEPDHQLHGAFRQLRVLDRLLRSEHVRDRG